MMGYNMNDESPDRKGADFNPSIRFVAKIDEQKQLL
jgi:hypothetical protein